MYKCSAFFISTLLIILSCNAIAQSFPAVGLIEVQKKNEFWINPGLYSYHFDQNQDLNSMNYGIGGEYRFLSVASITAGTYRNSHYHQSSYVGTYWQPIAVGPIKIGMVAGAFNGYQNTNNGGWFPAILPALTIEGEMVGVNLMIIPTIPNRVSGSLSLQFKLRVF